MCHLEVKCQEEREVQCCLRLLFSKNNNEHAEHLWCLYMSKMNAKVITKQINCSHLTATCVQRRPDKFAPM